MRGSYYAILHTPWVTAPPSDLAVIPPCLPAERLRSNLLRSFVVVEAFRASLALSSQHCVLARCHFYGGEFCKV